MGLCLIYNIALILSFEIIYPESLKVKDMTAEIISLKEETNYYYKYEIKVYSYNLNFTKGTKIILYTKDSELFPGNFVKINGDFEKAQKATNYKQFNYRNYLKQSKIYGIIYENNVEIIEEKKDTYYFFANIRNFLLERIRLNYNNETYGFMQGILMGDSNNFQEDIKENFKSASISHILAISGMHISIIIIFVDYLLKLFIESRKVRNSCLIIFLIFFYIITGMSTSCFRAIIMVGINLIGFNLKRKSNFISSLIVSFLIIISTNVYNIFNVGLWLSFMGVLGICVFSKVILSVVRHFCERCETLLKLIVPYISSQILILPIIIYSFNIFSCFSLISNIFASLLIDKILILGYISILLNSKFLAYINSFLISTIFKVSDICSMGKIYFKTPNIIFLIIYYVIILGISFYAANNRFKFWKSILNKKMRKKAYKVIVIIILIMLTLSHLNMDKNLKIYFVDIGQGDSTVIKTPNGKNIIIDGGEENNIILPYLLDREIIKIDYLIVSHFDSDHVEGLFSIMENIKVEKAIIGKQFEDSKNYKTFLEIAKKKKIDILVVEAGNKINIENNINIEVLWPCSENVIKENILNNNSLVFKFTYKEFSMLFTGDIEEIAEEKLVKMYENKLKTTILKVAHHGSKTSSIEEFLEYVRPKICLIGVGKNNSFGHPSQEVIKRLTEFRYENI